MVCLACAAWSSRGSLCRRCEAVLRPAPEHRLEGGLLVRSVYLHEGAARRLVHLLKYQAMLAAGEFLARRLLPLLPVETTALVPAPRVLVRHWRYGIDPAMALARSVSRLADLPVRRLLQAPLWSSPQAGRRRGGRQPPRFLAIGEPVEGMVLIDDVLTTGGTLSAAHHALGTRASLGLTATAAPL